MQCLYYSDDPILVSAKLFDADYIGEKFKKTTNIKIDDSIWPTRNGPKSQILDRKKPGFTRKWNGKIYGRPWMKKKICRDWKHEKCNRHWVICKFFHMCSSCHVIGEHANCSKTTEKSSSFNQNDHNYQQNEIEFKTNYDNNDNNKTNKYYNNNQEKQGTATRNSSSIKQRKSHQPSTDSDDDDYETDETDTTLYEPKWKHKNKSYHSFNADLNHGHKINSNNDNDDKYQQLGGPMKINGKQR